LVEAHGFKIKMADKPITRDLDLVAEAMGVPINRVTRRS
jgi:hypothetical protein